jgi:hypothetical protein
MATECYISEYFALIDDEATDVLTHKQISVCVRFVECTGRKVTLRGEFLGFVRANETTCEKAGAANMSGVHRGAQSRIRERIPTAQYVHCEAHVLNLAIVHSSSDVSVRIMVATVQEIAFAFRYSSKKWINLSKNYAGTMP